MFQAHNIPTFQNKKEEAKKIRPFADEDDVDFYLEVKSNFQQTEHTI